MPWVVRNGGGVDFFFQFGSITFGTSESSSIELCGTRYGTDSTELTELIFVVVFCDSNNFVPLKPMCCIA